jgi:undecaprenyl-diphosphatase
MRQHKLILTFLIVFNISIFISAANGDANEVSQQSSVQKISVVRAAILGIVEGLTEYLPVSSTGHLILAGHFMGLTYFSEHIGPFGRVLDKDKMEAINSFNIVIQSGAILAVIGLYRRRVFDICTGLLGKNRDGLKLFFLLLIAFLPSAIIGLPLHKIIEQQLFAPIPVAYGLGVGGLIMIVVELFVFRKKKLTTIGVENISFVQAAIIGFAQVLAMWPGTSRSMITIVAAVVVGIDMITAAEFSFLLALPTLMGATLVSCLEDWTILTKVVGIEGMAVGLLFSMIFAALAIKGFVKWLTSHGLIPFGIYRIIIAILVFWLFTAK